MPSESDKRGNDRSPPKKSPRTQERKPTGTKGEELSSQGQVDEGSRKRPQG